MWSGAEWMLVEVVKGKMDVGRSGQGQNGC